MASQNRRSGTAIARGVAGRRDAWLRVFSERTECYVLRILDTEVRAALQAAVTRANQDNKAAHLYRQRCAEFITAHWQTTEVSGSRKVLEK